MTKSKTDRPNVPVANQNDRDVISLKAQADQKSPLDEIIREGARRMLQARCARSVGSLGKITQADVGVPLSLVNMKTYRWMIGSPWCGMYSISSLTCRRPR